MWILPIPIEGNWEDLQQFHNINKKLEKRTCYIQASKYTPKKNQKNERQITLATNYLKHEKYILRPNLQISKNS